MKPKRKITYHVSVPDKWWCDKCKKFINHDECIGHQRSSSAFFLTIKQVEHCANKTFATQPEIKLIIVERDLKLKRVIQSWEYRR